MNKTFLLAAAAAAALVATPALAAHDLPPGDNNSPIVSGLIGTGALLADTGLQAVSLTQAGVTLDTLMRAAVYDAGGGYLDFMYQINNLQTSNTSIDELSFADFSGFDVVGAWQQLSSFGVFIDGVEEADSAERNPSGITLGVAFDTGMFPDVDFGASPLLNPGETSAIFQFRVAATRYRPGTFTAQNGIAITGQGFSPAIPEPATWAMMIMGFGAAGAMIRRKRSAGAPA